MRVILLLVLFCSDISAAPLRGKRPIILLKQNIATKSLTTPATTNSTAVATTTAVTTTTPTITPTAEHEPPLLTPGMQTFPTYNEAATVASDGKAHPMEHADKTIVFMPGAIHPNTQETHMQRIDNHSPDVALAVDAAMSVINGERATAGSMPTKIINILAARSGVLTGGSLRFSIKVQLRHDGGRLEFQKVVVDKIPPVSLRPPQIVPPTSEVLMIPPASTWNVVSHQIVRSPFSAPRHRASMVLVPGKVAAASAVMQAISGETTPLAKPPATPPATPP